MKKIDERRNYLLNKINHNDLKSKKYKKTCRYLNYFEQLLIFASVITDCVSISEFASFWVQFFIFTSIWVLLGIASSAVGNKICVITAGIRKYKSIIKKKKTKHDKIMFLGKDMLNTIEVLIYKA